MTHDQNTIHVGAKPPMNYVLAIVNQFNDGSDRMVLKARGRAISRAVDVAEIVRNRFVEEARVEDIRIGTERVASERGRSSNVSNITIVLARPATTSGDGPEDVLRVVREVSEEDARDTRRPLKAPA